MNKNDFNGFNLVDRLILDVMGQSFCLYGEDDFGFTETEENKFEYRIEMPGIKKEDINVSLEKTKLTINYIRDKKKDKVSVHFPKDLNGETLIASLDLGVLTLKADKKEDCKPIDIKIK